MLLSQLQPCLLACPSMSDLLFMGDPLVTGDPLVITRAVMGPLAMAGLPLLERLGRIDPSPLFVLSLLPYLAFLWLAGQIRGFPRLALRGFQLTLVFVAVTIGASLLALQTTGRQLADVDLLHGGAEAFLTLANLLIALGFSQAVAASAPGDKAGSPSQVNKP
jgi:hypothetical protein